MLNLQNFENKPKNLRIKNVCIVNEDNTIENSV